MQKLPGLQMCYLKVIMHTVNLKIFFKHVLDCAVWTQQKDLGLRFTMMYSPSAIVKKDLVRYLIAVLSVIEAINNLCLSISSSSYMV